MPEDYFWNILLTEQGLELIASQFYVACGYLLFDLGMAGVGCGCGLGFHGTLDFAGRSPPGPTPSLIVMFLLFFKSFSCRFFSLAKLQKWNPICVNKQSDLSKLSPGKAHLLNHLFSQYPSPPHHAARRDRNESVGPRGRSPRRRWARSMAQGGTVPDSVWLRIVLVLCFIPHRPEHQGLPACL